MRGDDIRTRSLSHFRLSFHIWDCQMPPGFAGCGKMKKFYSFLPSLCLDCQNPKKRKSLEAGICACANSTHSSSTRPYLQFLFSNSMKKPTPPVSFDFIASSERGILNDEILSLSASPASHDSPSPSCFPRRRCRSASLDSVSSYFRLPQFPYLGLPNDLGAVAWGAAEAASSLSSVPPPSPLVSTRLRQI